MTAHELAQKLLEGPDYTVKFQFGGGLECPDIEITEIELHAWVEGYAYVGLS